MKKKILITIATILCILVIAAVVLLANLGETIKLTANTFLPKLTEAEARIENVEVKPFSGEASIHGFVIGNPEGYHSDSAIEFSEFSITLDPGSVTSDKIHVHEVLIRDPKITYELGLGNSNIGTLIKNMEKNLAAVVSEREQSESASEPKKVVIDHVRIEGAMVVISSKLTLGVGAPIPLPTIDIKDLGKDNPDGISPLKAFTMILSKLSTAVLSVVTNVGGAVVEGAADAAGVVIEGAADAAGAVIGGAGDAAGAVLGGAGDAAGAVVGGAGDAAGAVVEGAGKAVGGAINKVGGGLKGLLGSGNDEKEEAE